RAGARLPGRRQLRADRAHSRRGRARRAHRVTIAHQVPQDLRGVWLPGGLGRVLAFGVGAGGGHPVRRSAGSEENSMRRLSSAALIAGLAATLVSFVAPADAQVRRRDPGFSTVTAESRYTSATITAPVRYGPHGRLEVRLPGGTWLECGLSCS